MKRVMSHLHDPEFMKRNPPKKSCSTGHKQNRSLLTQGHSSLSKCLRSSSVQILPRAPDASHRFGLLLTPGILLQLQKYTVKA